MNFKNISIGYFLILMILTTSIGFASKKPIENQNAGLKTKLFSKPFLSFGSLSDQQIKTDVQTSATKRTKSPKKGMLFSLLIPGSGEFYSKSWLKGLFFIGVEAGSWYAYSKLHKEGKNIEDEYIAYAEEHWSKEKWELWWQSFPDSAIYAHHQLPDTKTQQYYEMIGKYQKYNAGWDDISAGNALTDTSQHSLYYMERRGDSNDKLKQATTFTAIALANHVLSAIDAVWTVNRYNKKVKSTVDLDYVFINNKPQLMANLRLNW